MQGSWYNPQGFFAFFDNEGFIVASDYTGQKKVGVTLAKYNQMEKMANEAMGKAEAYYKTLEENDLIEHELTADEKISMLSGQVEQLTQLVTQLVGKEQQAQSRKKAVTPEISPPEKGKGN